MIAHIHLRDNEIIIAECFSCPWETFFIRLCMASVITKRKAMNKKKASSGFDVHYLNLIYLLLKLSSGRIKLLGGVREHQITAYFIFHENGKH